MNTGAIHNDHNDHNNDRPYDVSVDIVRGAACMFIHICLYMSVLVLMILSPMRFTRSACSGDYGGRGTERYFVAMGDE